MLILRVDDFYKKHEEMNIIATRPIKIKPPITEIELIYKIKIVDAIKID